MITKRKKVMMTVSVMIISVDRNSGSNKDECFNLDEVLLRE